MDFIAPQTPIDWAISLLISLMVFSSVFMVIYSIFRYPAPLEPPVHRRIAMALGTGERQTIFEQPGLQPILSLFMQMAKRFNFKTIRDRIRRDLNASGNPSGYSVDEYIAICLLMGIATCLLVGFLTWLLLGFPEPLMITFSLVVGFWVPLAALKSEATKRVSRISKQLPYTLDLIALMMASGATFAEAISTIIRDNPDDDLNQELAVVQREIDFGTNRAQALVNVAERVPLETLRSVVGAINQAEALGTPLSTILKNQSSILRMHRSVRAEKLSASASLRILIPSMLILLAVVVVVLGPLILKWMQGRMYQF